MWKLVLSLSCASTISISAQGEFVPAQIVGGYLSEGYTYYGWDYDEEWFNDYQLTDYAQGTTTDYSSWSVSDDELSFQSSYSDWSYDTADSNGNSNGYAEEDHWGFFSAEISATDNILMNGWGNMKYQIFDADGNEDFTGMTGDLDSLQLTTGVYTIVIFGSNEYADGGSYNYSKGDYDYWGHDYDAEGGVNITAVPTPGALALLGLVGVATRRRRK